MRKISTNFSYMLRKFHFICFCHSYKRQRQNKTIKLDFDVNTNMKFRAQFELYEHLKCSDYINRNRNLKKPRLISVICSEKEVRQNIIISASFIIGGKPTNITSKFRKSIFTLDCQIILGDLKRKTLKNRPCHARKTMIFQANILIFKKLENSSKIPFILFVFKCDTINISHFRPRNADRYEDLLKRMDSFIRPRFG